MENAPILQRLTALREKLHQAYLDGFLVPQSDAFQNEYLPASDQRLKYLTGFTGSSGFAVILMDRAAFFTDSRYTIQASREVPASLFACFDMADKSPFDWIKEQQSTPLKLGFDPWLHTAQSIEKWKSFFDESMTYLLPVDANPIDAIWIERPLPPCTPVFNHPPLYTGETSTDKITSIAATLDKEKLDATLISDAASIAWLLNVRGNDVAHAPLPLSYALIHKNATVDWFIDPRKMTNEVEQALSSSVYVHPIKDFILALQQFSENSPRVRVAPSNTSHIIVETLKRAGAFIKEGDDLCAMPKAVKNKVEVEGMRSAHKKDGLALVRFLKWFDETPDKTTLTECDIDTKLTALRSQGELFKELSFPTIAGTGPNGAVVHYRATPQNNTNIQDDSFLLIDSGAHYLDGTTDVTRTLLVGRASTEMQDRYTRVLKGMICLSSARFPEGTTGAELDILARQNLWKVGLDYGHGTGHGVGSYLCVHEGPQSLSRRSLTPLKPGMVLSVEPGYYEENRFGIRIENLVVVVQIPKISNNQRQMLGFETLTLAPIDCAPIIRQMLLPSEREWLNDYHFKTRDTLLPLIDDDQTKQWLIRATEEI